MSYKQGSYSLDRGTKKTVKYVKCYSRGLHRVVYRILKKKQSIMLIEPGLALPMKCYLDWILKRLRKPVSLSIKQEYR